MFGTDEAWALRLEAATEANAAVAGALQESHAALTERNAEAEAAERDSGDATVAALQRQVVTLKADLTAAVMQLGAAQDEVSTWQDAADDRQAKLGASNEQAVALSAEAARANAHAARLAAELADAEARGEKLQAQLLGFAEARQALQMAAVAADVGHAAGHPAGSEQPAAMLPDAGVAAVDDLESQHALDSAAAGLGTGLQDVADVLQEIEDRSQEAVTTNEALREKEPIGMSSGSVAGTHAAAPVEDARGTRGSRLHEAVDNAADSNTAEGCMDASAEAMLEDAQLLHSARDMIHTQPARLADPHHTAGARVEPLLAAGMDRQQAADALACVEPLLAAGMDRQQAADALAPAGARSNSLSWQLGDAEHSTERLRAQAAAQGRVSAAKDAQHAEAAAALRAALHDAEEDAAGLRMQIFDLGGAMAAKDALHAEASRKLQVALRDAEARHGTLQGQLLASGMAGGAWQERRMMLQAQREEAAEKLRVASRDAADAEARCETLQGQMLTYAEERAAWQERLAMHEARLVASSLELSEAHGEAASLQELLSEAQAQNASLQGQLQAAIRGGEEAMHHYQVCYGYRVIYL